MRHAALSLAIAVAASLTAGACLQKDTTTTIYLRPDGSFDWVILEQNVRSDERDEAARLAEEVSYLDGVSRGDTATVNSLLKADATDVRVRWLRSTRPYAAMVDARFDNLARAFDRMLSPCGIPHESTITEADGVMTWTLRADVGVDGERLDAAGTDACGEGLGGLDDALDELHIVLESGTFTAAKGFTIKGTDTADFDEKTIEENVRATGIVELSLSWR